MIVCGGAGRRAITGAGVGGGGGGGGGVRRVVRVAAVFVFGLAAFFGVTFAGGDVRATARLCLRAGCWGVAGGVDSTGALYVTVSSPCQISSCAKWGALVLSAGTVEVGTSSESSQTDCARDWPDVQKRRISKNADLFT